MTTSFAGHHTDPADTSRRTGPLAGGFDRKVWARWLASFIGFPLAGLAARAATGPIDGTDAAIVGGLAAGAVLGAIQAFALLRSMTARAEWAVATAIGLSAGLAVGATAVDFATDAASLGAMGVATGAGVGIAQALVMSATRRRRLAWAVATSALWGLGWLITSQVISDTDSQYATFGASGALAATALGGILLATEPATVQYRSAAPTSLRQSIAATVNRFQDAMHARRAP